MPQVLPELPADLFFLSLWPAALSLIHIFYIDCSTDNSACLHLSNLWICYCKTASTVSHHWVELMKAVDDCLDLLNSFTPVSYTHLDVYKRQVSPLLRELSATAPDWCLAGYSQVTLEKTNSWIWFFFHAICSPSVSYTHLCKRWSKMAFCQRLILCYWIPFKLK